MIRSLDEFRQEAIKKLEKISEDPLREYMELFSAATGLSKTHALTNFFEVNSKRIEDLRLLETYISQRCTGVPLPYITGMEGFWKKEFRVTADTLIPRPETELLVELILSENKKKCLKVLDLGTGTGAIGISIAEEMPNWKITATDISLLALRTAKINSRGLKNINFVQCFWLNSIGTSFDIIVSNPPYICDDDPHLKYLRHEPRLALEGGRDGLDPAREIIKTAKKNLVEKGRLYLEHGYDQKDDVTQILRQSDFCTIKSYKDFAGHDRVIKAHS